MTFDPLKLKLEQLKECPICGGVNIPVRVVSYFGPLPIQYCQCGECGIIFLNPRMTDKQTARYYKGPYRDYTSKGELAKDIEWERKRAATQVKILKPYLGRVRSNLEIGSSTGSLMEALKGLRIESVGVEPDGRYRQAEPGVGFKVYSDISEVEAQSFDMISSSHSIEHLNQPVEFYENLVRNFSHEKTIFMVETPNTRIYPTFAVHHPFVFTEATLDGLLARVGLEAIKHFYHNLDRSTSAKYLVGLYRRTAALTLPSPKGRGEMEEA